MRSYTRFASSWTTPFAFTSLCKEEPRRPHCACTDHWSFSFSSCKWYTLSELPWRKYNSARSICIVRSFALLVLPLVHRRAVHEKQVPSWRGEAPVHPRSQGRGVGVHRSEAESLDGRSGRIRRRVWPGRDGEIGCLEILSRRIPPMSFLQRDDSRAVRSRIGERRKHLGSGLLNIGETGG